MRRKKLISTTSLWRQFFCSTDFCDLCFLSLQSEALWIHQWPTVPTASKVCKPLYCSNASKTWRKLTFFCLIPMDLLRGCISYFIKHGEIPASYVGLPEGKYPSFDIDSGSPRHLTRLSWLMTVMLPTSRMPFSSQTKGPNKHLSNAKNPGCLRIMLPSYMGILMSQYEDPY